MSEPTPHRSSEALATLGKLVLDFRLFALLFALVGLIVSDQPVEPLAAALFLAMLVSLVPLLRWDTFGPWLLAHPSVVIVDVVTTVGVLLLTGVYGPLLYYTLGTAFFIGLLFGTRRGLAPGALLLAGWALAVWLRAPLREAPLGFHELVGMPVLLVLSILGAAAVRRVLVANAGMVDQLAAERARAAVGDERARMARELHDSLGKTLHGIALGAASLRSWVRTDPDRAADEAAGLQRAAERAAREARDLLTTLRSDRLDRPFDEAVRALASSWAHRTGVAVDVDVGLTRPVPAEWRHELLSALGEALRNTERHAPEASRVGVRAGEGDDALWLEVGDDGPGLAEALDPERLAENGHYGLVGICERARRLGGRAGFCGDGGFRTTVVLPLPPASAGNAAPVSAAASTAEGPP